MKHLFTLILFGLTIQTLGACSNREENYSEFLHSTIQKRAKDFEQEQIDQEQLEQECVNKGMVLQKGQCVASPPKSSPTSPPPQPTSPPPASST